MVLLLVWANPSQPIMSIGLGNTWSLRARCGPHSTDSPPSWQYNKYSWLPNVGKSWSHAFIFTQNVRLESEVGYEL